MHKKQHPNILFLISDQQQQATITPESPCHMPNISLLRDSGVTFSQARTVNAICSPARASLMTGLYPHNHGMVDNTHCVEKFRADFQNERNLLSKQLKVHGYRLGYFGKWHVERTGSPEAFGFDQFTTEYHGREFPRTLEKSRIIKQFGYNDRVLYGVHRESIEETEESFFYDQGIEFIQKSQNRSEPWCAFISTNAPHDPYIAPEELYKLYNPSEITLPESFEDLMEDKPGIYRRLKSVWKDLTRQDFQEATACYYANCTLVDSQVGRVIDLLESTGQRENTIIIYLSDHGDMMGGHGLLCKGVPAFDESYRIPLIISWPGHIPSGDVCATYASIIDIAPTVLELTECQSMKDIDGESLIPCIKGEANSLVRSIYAEFFGQRLSFSQRIVWKDKYKYVFNSFDFDELYDLSKDPAEMKNLTNDPQYRSIAVMMAQEMWRKAKKSGDHCFLESEYFMYRFAPIGPETVKKASIYNRGA